MLVPTWMTLGFMLSYSVAIFAVSTEFLPETNYQRFQSSIRELSKKTEQIVREVLSMNPREEVVYYGQYQAYGNVSWWTEIRAYLASKRGPSH